MTLFPEQKPEGLQMWPLGQGVVVNTVAVSGGNGMLILAGVPDAMRGNPGDEMEGEPLDLIRRLIALPDNQSCIMVYPTVEAIDATISQLSTLKHMMLGDPA